MSLEKLRKSRKVTRFSRDRVKIEFPFQWDLVEKIKTLPNRTYHKGEYNQSFWTIPIIPSAIKQLKDWDFEIESDLLPILSPATITNNIPGLNATLRPYQYEGIRFIQDHGGRVLLADDMGLGKTIQVIGYMVSAPHLQESTIIVCPSSLKYNWVEEFQKFTTFQNIHVLSGTKAGKLPKSGIYIINYDIISYWIEKLLEINPQLIVFDEAHYLKSGKTKRTKAAKSIVKFIPHVIGITGTPIENRPMEIYNPVWLINRQIFPNYMNFGIRYCGGKKNQYGWDFSGASNIKELHEKLTSTIMLRRKKVDVLKDLPDKIYSFVPLKLDNEKEYQKAESDILSYIKEVKGLQAALKASRAETFSIIETLKQLAVKGILNEAKEWIEDFLESGEKLVVFTTHKFTIDFLYEAFKEVAVIIDGSVSPDKRQGIVQQFQNDPQIRLFIGNMEAAGVGLTLTAASNVAILEYPWNPSKLAQAIDRCHRIGQKFAVNVWFFMAINSIQEKIAKLLDKKQKIVNGVVDGIASDENDLLGDLLTEYFSK